MAYVNRRPYFYDGIFSGKLGMSIISVDGGGGGGVTVLWKPGDKGLNI